MRNHPEAVCLGHEDLDFAFRLKLGRSDDYGFWSYFSNAEKEKHTDFKRFTGVLYHRTLFKQLHVYHGILPVIGNKHLVN